MNKREMDEFALNRKIFSPFWIYINIRKSLLGRYQIFILHRNTSSPMRCFIIMVDCILVVLLEGGDLHKNEQPPASV